VIWVESGGFDDDNPDTGDEWWPIACPPVQLQLGLFCFALARFIFLFVWLVGLLLQLLLPTLPSFPPSPGLLALCGLVRPMINHIMDQPELVRGEGPIGIVVAPTRELVLQIVAETKRFGKPSVIKSRAHLL
jgi:hypothetical protein